MPFADFGEAMAAIRDVGPGGHFLGTRHTLDHFEQAFFIPGVMDFSPFEQWSAEGARDHDQRGRDRARAMLAAYEEPPMEEGLREALDAFVARREGEIGGAAL
jgi:trimethylamine--corrinoid protein Co-methyltransferase